MGQRLLPQNLIELYAHALAIEREAFKRFTELERYMREVGYDHIADEFERIGREEQEQYEALAIGTAERELPALADWEYAWHYLGLALLAEGKKDEAREAFLHQRAMQPAGRYIAEDVHEGVQGALVPPGDVGELSAALAAAIVERPVPRATSPTLAWLDIGRRPARSTSR